MEEQLAALLQSVQEGRAANDAKLEAIQQSLELWRPVVLNLQGQLDELRTQVGRIAIHPALADPAPPTVVQQVPPPPSAVESGHHGPSGHGGIDNSGGLVHGVVTTLAPPPVKGQWQRTLLKIQRGRARRAGAGHRARRLQLEPPHPCRRKPRPDPTR
ncbi:uncharacterized protein [Triticum aestivum]|uniref:uncharacterized protein isoform X2 n=1 Tax=Triticum aestivum TaxID=4565 RepID=UPI001D026963|nr:uncharacterized protein LOC123047833 isoform X2 [Triticum aestivum]